MFKKVKTSLVSSKASGPDYIVVLVLKNYQPEHSCISADFFKVSPVFCVFKNVGERFRAKNQLPVSSLFVSKIFEKL